jgi:hypothetical protein
MLFWKELLEASGGKLELPKCFYYILAWKFDLKGNPLPVMISEQKQKPNKLPSQIQQPIYLSPSYKKKSPLAIKLLDVTNPL